jgi:acetolactate synthase-1/2/3 large subunit
LAISRPTDLSIVADAREAISDLSEAIKSLATRQRLASIREQRYEKVTTYTSNQRAKRLATAKRAWDQAPMKTSRISIELNALLDDDAFIVKEATPIGAPEWFDFGPGRKTLVGGFGTTVLGWATGAAIGVKLAKPDSQVVAISGDGAFMFQHALWGLSRHDAPIIVVIYNNRDYNTSRAFQWRGAQARLKKDIINYLGDPDVDFSLIAKAYGVDGEVVTTPAELRPAIQRAIASTNNGKAYLLDVLSERWGPGGEMAWHPDTSIAKMRKEFT